MEILVNKNRSVIFIRESRLKKVVGGMLLRQAILHNFKKFMFYWVLSQKMLNDSYSFR